MAWALLTPWGNAASHVLLVRGGFIKEIVKKKLHLRFLEYTSVLLKYVQRAAEFRILILMWVLLEGGRC